MTAASKRQSSDAAPAILRIGEMFYVPAPLHEDNRPLATEVVPCDDAAIERAALALHLARGLSRGSFGMDRYCECREFAEAALRAAGKTP